MAAEKPLSPEEDAAKMGELKSLFDAADADLAASGMPVDEDAVEGEIEEAGAEAGLDLTPMMDTLGATEERAQMLYDAAQQIEKTAGKTPQELSDMIADDFDILMQLEMVAARGEGGAMGGPAAGEIPPPGPAEMPPGEMMPPEGM